MNNQIEEYIKNIPIRKIEHFTTDEKGIVTLEIENKGFFNRLAQKLFKKPKISYIHLDEMGSFVWPFIDGERNIKDIGVFVDEHFGEKAHPLYERLSKYFSILASYGFVGFKENK